MKDRTLKILAALIKDFIDNATPVPSKKLLQSGDFKISSATIRNEFSVLEEIGLIQSPHVSSGKIPTQKGYRFFVDEFLDLEEKTTDIMQIFEQQIITYKKNKSKESLFDVLRLIVQLSGNAAFANLDDERSFYLGLSNVIREPEFIKNPERIARIIEILEGKEFFQNFLNNLDIKSDEVKIFIGKENLLDEISSCAMLVTVFKTENISGKIGILGPMRMKYGFNKMILKNIQDMIL